jgi:hypothetical protein
MAQTSLQMLGEKVIYFSDNVEESEEDELTEIFYESTKKHSKNYSLQ